MNFVITMRSESKAVFLLAILSLNFCLSLAHLPDSKRQVQLQTLKTIAEDLKGNEKKLEEKLLASLSALSMPELTLQDINYHVKAPLTDVDISIPKTIIDDTTKLSVSKVDITFMKRSITVEIAVQQLKLSGSYKASGQYWWQPVQSQGAFEINTNLVKLVGSGKISMDEEITLENMKFSSDVGKTKESFEDIINSKDLKKSMSKLLIQNVLLSGIKNFQDSVISTIRQTLSGISHCSLMPCSLSPQTHSSFIKRSSDNINHLVEEALITLSSNMPDPADLPDLGIEWGFWPFILKIGFFDGYVEGLSNLARASDWFLDSDGSAATVEGRLAVFNMKSGYEFEWKYMGIGVDFDLMFYISYFDIDVVLDVDLVNCVAHLSTFEAVNIGDVDVEADGWILVDWMIEILVQLVTDIFLGIFVAIIESIVSNIVEEIVESIEVCTALLPPYLVQKV